VPTAVVHAVNLSPWTWVVDGIVNVKVYVTPVALGTAVEIVTDLEVIWPAALACRVIKGNRHENDNTITTKTTNNF
jgi:hypothetical protein